MQPDEDDYDDEIWLKVFFLFVVVVVSLLVCLLFLHIVKHKIDNTEASIPMFFTKKDGAVIFTEKKLSPLLATSNIW